MLRMVSGLIAENIRLSRHARNLEKGRRALENLHIVTLDTITHTDVTYTYTGTSSHARGPLSEQSSEGSFAGS